MICTDSSIQLMMREIKQEYSAYRMMGENREEAVRHLFDYYEGELEDDDERIAVLIGISLALCKKKELIPSVAKKTMKEIECVRRRFSLSKADLQYLKKIETMLKNETVYGNEAVYKKRTKYVSSWKVGDAFFHELSCPRSEQLGIKGWLVILCKVGEYDNRFGQSHQLMCVTVCPPEKKPASAEELQRLGFMKTMLSGKPEYLFQLNINSKRAENAYELTKIGSFPEVEIPKSCAHENPLVSYGLYGFKRKGEDWLTYEDSICFVYKRQCDNQGTIL